MHLYLHTIRLKQERHITFTCGVSDVCFVSEVEIVVYSYCFD